MNRLFKKLIKFSLIFLLCVFALFIISYQIKNWNLKEISDETRSASGGKYIKLNKGTIHYSLDGPETGEILVLVHGFSTPKFVFSKNIPAFVNAGYRVLSYDHFGRGYSDRPSEKYDKDLYDSELLELLELLKIQKPVNLAGYSMGGGIATLFASRHPERVKKLILMAPAGFIPEYKGTQALLLIPGLGEWLMSFIGTASLIKSYETEFQNGAVTEEMLNLYKEQMEYKGYPQALVSKLRYFPMQNLKEEYTLVGKVDLPVLVLWGTKDVDVPYSGAKEVVAAIPKAKLVTLEGEAHSFVYANPDFTNSNILKFLSEKK